MINSNNLRTVTDMRKNADKLLDLVSNSKEPVGILKNNKLEAYLVEPKVFEKLARLAEDFSDFSVLRERLKNSKKSDFIDFESFWNKNNLPK